MTLRVTRETAPFPPMLASTGEAPLDSPALAYEPKYDGIRAIVEVEPVDADGSQRAAPAAGDSAARVRIWSRLGNDKTSQFPEIVAALQHWGHGLDHSVVLDGEIVALDARGDPAGFQNLQGRIHLKSDRNSRPVAKRPAGAAKLSAGDDAATTPEGGDSQVAFITFDLLREGDTDLRRRPLRERRVSLERVMAGAQGPVLRMSEQAVGDGRGLYARAVDRGAEGLVAKRLDSVYQSGRRSPDWCKLKLVRHQTCVVAGWTEPRGSRPFFGALLLGVYDDGGLLHYIGHTGAGFNDAELGRVWRRLHALETKRCPYEKMPRTNERPHWIKPQLVAEVKFTEWTADGKLRHPTYLGMRDDVKPESVRKEPQRGVVSARTRGGPDGPLPRDVQVRVAEPARMAADRAPKSVVSKAAQKKILDQLDDIQDRGGSGVLDLAGGQRLDVTNLGKIFWPKSKLTKGDLLRHYVRAAAVILPVLADRPLVMKRYPNGVAAKPFYQHRAADSVPAGVRVEAVDAGNERRPHLIGGDLVTLLYTAQIASISQDPWFSRVGREALVDHIAIDLDPPEGLPFARVLDVARWVREELTRLKAPAFAKTSGAGGLHIYVPMPAETPYDAGLIYAQIVATMVANKHPKLATVERSVAARGRRIYVDYLQNIRGKTLASAYSARANDFAGVSTPLTWDEVDAGVSPQDFTIANFAERIAAVGDLWAGLRKAKGADLRAVSKVAR